VALRDAIWAERMPPCPSVPERRDPGEVGGHCYRDFNLCFLYFIHVSTVCSSCFKTAAASAGDAAVTLLVRRYKIFVFFLYPPS